MLMNAAALHVPHIPRHFQPFTRFTARHARRAAVVASALCLLGASGCSFLGPHQLRADQVDYERALGDAKKREMLATIVGLRFGDSPSFVAVSQIIAAYSFGAQVGPTLELGSGADPNFAQASGNVSYSNHPTFTFTPTTGESYAQAYIRPLPATLMLPLADSGVPIDLLLRLGVQSIGGLQNEAPLGGPFADGSPGFFELLRDLRRLQLAGELTFKYSTTPDHVGHVSMILGGSSNGNAEASNADLTQVRSLLHLAPNANEYEMVYGDAAPGGRQVTMVTRSVLGILSNLGAQIDVPPEDVQKGATTPTVKLIGGETRPTVIVHVGKKAPPDVYAAVGYHGYEYWITTEDFDSKYAMTVLQNLIALAQATQDSKAPIVTIPAS
ncbi:hypothetical protein [Paraburkholderia phosphatilytica]|uniref:hypothetical protein n=1 Tax=Paraburkholderia phosphatilytica TaxID=2282883 RepID=UPI001F0C90B6|nr:hypothetical protein [Paraburkholderia phosphatilytica]